MSKSIEPERLFNDKVPGLVEYGSKTSVEPSEAVVREDRQRR